MLNSELRATLFFHSLEKNTPLLVSSRLLRSMGAGQIDCAVVTPKGVLEVHEIKSSEIGILKAKSGGQKRRLKSACDFLGQIFHRPIKLCFDIF